MPYLWLAFTPKSVLWFATDRGHVFNDPGRGHYLFAGTRTENLTMS
ncbi:hypothetical protein SPAB_00795 [Salmonella enterica subsp. enterica serovar Paratyphi B str. SPB7]|uniref:Uncharacterized protein n=1 Tax=Salmonella paratyphi B (strain ATCC BAA-1250 / SPB7) TaxID=1016998 RepID=A0A6C6YZ80_SALPB|nr:hypothetical protein SPAB_00795 [Salmonella enterica subsp. enterica serovar Paratyphi B str. SPB7]